MAILDFDLASFLPLLEKRCCSPRGTVPFIAPELVDQKPHDHKVDVWSIGVMFMHLVLYCDHKC